MSNDGGAEMPSRRCRRRTSPLLGPLDDDDLLGEILLRLPPKPSSLPRASLVCKRWRSIATNAAFHCRFRTHHRKPPILGAFEENYRGIKFMPLLDPPDRIPSERFSLYLSADNIFTWSVLGCRHGRVLLLDLWAKALLVFEPVTGDTHRIIIPPEFVLDRFNTAANAAVFCAAGGDCDHVHGDCHTSPFKVAVVGKGNHDEVAIAQVYSQETGMWGDLVSSAEPLSAGVTFHRSTLIGNALYWGLYGNRETAEDYDILKFDLDNQSFTVINSPPPPALVDSQIQIIRSEDVGLGLAISSYPSFQLWDCIVDFHGLATWVMRKTFNIDTMLGQKAEYTHIEGYAEDTDAIFLSMYEAPDSDPPRRVLFIVHLDSMKVEKHRGSFRTEEYHLFTNFYAAGTART